MSRPRPHPHTIDLADALGFEADRPAAALAQANAQRRRETIRHHAVTLAVLAGGFGLAAFVLLA